MEEEKTVFEKLFDEKDDSNIVLYDEEEKAVEFEQCAIIPIKEDVYAILKPVKPMKGLGKDEALVFLLEETEEGYTVIEEYQSLLAEIMRTKSQQEEKTNEYEL